MMLANANIKIYMLAFANSRGMHMTTLKDLTIGKSAKTVSVGGKGSTRQHLLDMGIIPGTIIKMVKTAPMGDPIEYKLHGYSLTLRKDDAKTIEVEECAEEQIASNVIITSEHPGLGETGIRFHDYKNERAIPEGTTITFALVGNQNAGKTTLFNCLTGSNQHVGNFPGVTVDRKDGSIIGHPDTLVTDLPGIYSMSPYSPEELVSRDFVLDEKPNGIINIIDATSIERGLYLTMQLLELDIPMVVGLNMMDEIYSNGGYIDINNLEKELGVPVVPISAMKNQGISELIEHAMHVAAYQEKPFKQDFCDAGDNDGSVHRCLHSIMAIIEDKATKLNMPLRFCAAKCAEGDKLMFKRLNLDKNQVETINHIAKQMENERGLDKAAAIAEMRYSFIMKIAKDSIIKPKESKEEIMSSRIDRILTGKYTAIPSFVLIILLVFYLTFEVIGPYLENLLEALIGSLSSLVSKALISANVNQGLQSLVIDGIFAGVGSVLSFLPVIVLLFFFLSVLEDSGYMARIAFVMDKLLRRIGLSGRSIIPLLIGFGCTVPGVMSSRTLPSQRDRQMTILLTPFMSCSAKLPIYAFFAHTFFPEHQGLVTVSLYLLGIIVAIIIAHIFRKTIFKGEAVPFVMELPSYRMPSARNVSKLLWEKAKDFLQRAFTIIFTASVLIWFMQNFSFSMTMASSQEESILAKLAGIIAPIFKPLGFGDWRVVVSLISGFMAKESVVSTLKVLFAKGSLQTILNSASAASLLVYCLLYTPCVAAISAIKQEMGSRWALFVVIFQCVIAWICAFIIYHLFLSFI